MENLIFALFFGGGGGNGDDGTWAVDVGAFIISLLLLLFFFETWNQAYSIKEELVVRQIISVAPSRKNICRTGGDGMTREGQW